MKKMDPIIVYLQYKGGAIWRVKKQSHISISKAPGALFRENTVCDLPTKGNKGDKIVAKSVRQFPTRCNFQIIDTIFFLKSAPGAFEIEIKFVFLTH